MTAAVVLGRLSFRCIRFYAIVIRTGVFESCQRFQPDAALNTEPFHGCEGGNQMKQCRRNICGSWGCFLGSWTLPRRRRTSGCRPSATSGAIHIRLPPSPPPSPPPCRPRHRGNQYGQSCCRRHRCSCHATRGQERPPHRDRAGLQFSGLNLGSDPPNMY